MTDTNQLPEPELGYIQTDKSNQPAFSARQMREAMKHALQASAMATQAEVTDEQILEVAEPFGEFQYGDAQGDKRIDFARAILALRHERVPMTDEQVDSFRVDGRLHWLGKRQLIRAVEAHHGISAKAKKETP